MKSDKKWLLLVDLDKTLWDHDDISQLKPPFKKINGLSIVDSNGVKVSVYSEIVYLVKWAKSNGALTVTLSWNVPEVAIEALKALELTDLFDYHAIEYISRKDLIAKRLVEEITRNGLLDVLECVVFIDDLEDNIKKVSSVIPRLCGILAWFDFKDYGSLLKTVKKCLQKCRIKLDDFTW